MGTLYTPMCPGPNQCIPSHYRQAQDLSTEFHNWSTLETLARVYNLSLARTGSHS